jgi:hypothetical protein
MRAKALLQFILALLYFRSGLCFLSPKLFTSGKYQKHMILSDKLDQKGVAGLLPKNSPLRSARRLLAVSILMQDTADNFLSWAASQGIQFESLSLKSFDGVRGIGASSSNLKAGDVVLSVPESAVLRVLADSSSLPSKLENENFVSEKVSF